LKQGNQAKAEEVLRQASNGSCRQSAGECECWQDYYNRFPDKLDKSQGRIFKTWRPNTPRTLSCKKDTFAFFFRLKEFTQPARTVVNRIDEEQPRKIPKLRR